MHPRTSLGLLGIAGIWLTAGTALPFVNVLTMFTPEQLMVFRGFLTAGMALIGLRGIVGRADIYTYLIALTLPLATLGLFEGIRHWGAGPTIIIITATPLVNFAISAFIGRKIPRASITGLVLVLGGVVMARWGGHFQWAGFLWTTFATVMNGVLYEFFSRAQKGTWKLALQKCFWGSIGMGTLGLVLSLVASVSWVSIAEPKFALMVVGFAFVGGFLYWIANLLAFENLPTNEASVLAQGETPAVILGAGAFLGESLSFVQWLGVAIALCGSWYLTRWLTKQKTVEGKGS